MYGQWVRRQDVDTTIIVVLVKRAFMLDLIYQAHHYAKLGPLVPPQMPFLGVFPQYPCLGFVMPVESP